ncbi:hypothetical protein EIP91_007738 [Steccherinum ochraceum]|uniref:Uncharacterized protein n=1 Tax=Steccherinum ochraceum TaxID=92696 RepID=A0A4R0RLG6_9APHY|nr:hypothetical protein EIP91_007738 [Steccherinum ochraceum]
MAEETVPTSTGSSPSTKTIIIASVTATGAIILLLGTVILVTICRRRRRQHVQVPTDDPDSDAFDPETIRHSTPSRRQSHSRNKRSIDSISDRPLLSDDNTLVSRSSPPLSYADRAGKPRQHSNLRYAQTYHGDSVDSEMTLTALPSSSPLFDTKGKDQMIQLSTGLTILSPTPPRSHEDEESVDSHAAPSTIELPNPFAESIAPSSASERDPSDLSRNTTDVSSLTTTTRANAHTPLVESPKELSKPTPLPDLTSGNDADVHPEVVSPAEILPVPFPAKLHSASLLSPVATPSSPRSPLPSPPPSASRHHSVLNAVIRPLPRAPTQKAQLTRNKTAKSQSADMRIAVLNNSASSKDNLKRSLDAESEADSASMYSQASAPGSVWSELVNPHDSAPSSKSSTLVSTPADDLKVNEFALLVNPHDRNVASVRRDTFAGGARGGRPRPARSNTTNSIATPTPSASGSSNSSRTTTLSPLAENADPGSAAASMRFALAQAVEAARRDSLYHAELELEMQKRAMLPLPSGLAEADRPTSGVSVISADVEQFEQDMQSWLASARVASPTALR